MVEELTNGRDKALKLLSAWKDIKSANVIDEGGYEKERFSDITTKQLKILLQDILRKEINLNDEFR